MAADPENMDAMQSTEQVRVMVRDWFAQRDANPDAELTETMLIRGGFLYGRRFANSDWVADWDIAACKVRFHTPAGPVIGELDVPERVASHEHNRAA